MMFNIGTLDELGQIDPMPEFILLQMCMIRNSKQETEIVNKMYLFVGNYFKFQINSIHVVSKTTLEMINML